MIWGYGVLKAGDTPETCRILWNRSSGPWTTDYVIGHMASCTSSMGWTVIPRSDGIGFFGIDTRLGTSDKGIIWVLGMADARPE